MSVNKLTFPSKENAVQEKINEIIDNLGGGASALTDLSDVTITSAASGQALCYDGSKWVNAPKTRVIFRDWS